MGKFKFLQLFALLSATVLLGLTAVYLGNNSINESKAETESTAELSTESTAELSTESSAESSITDSQPSAPLTSPKREITISFAGDVTLGNNQKQGLGGTFIEKYNSEGPTWFFDGVRDVFANDDMTLVNLECVLSRSEDLVKKTWNLKGYPEYNEILTDGSIEAVSMGNNHRMDYSDEGEKDTVDAVKEVGIVYAYDENVGIYHAKDDIDVGFISVDEVYDHELVEDYIKDGIASLKASNVNIIIACCHWGIERDYYPNDYQKYLARLCIDEGADMVIGCHPHVLQGIDNYHGKYIFYSLGNFCFGGNRNPVDQNTMIAQATFHLVGDSVYTPGTEVCVIPCTLSSVKTHNDFQPTIAEGKRYEQIISKLNDYSSPFNVTIDDEGTVTR